MSERRVCGTCLFKSGDWRCKNCGLYAENWISQSAMMYQGNEGAISREDWDNRIDISEDYQVIKLQKVDSEFDDVKKPKHYVANDGTEVKDVLTSFGYHKNSHRWNAGKYILRAGRKNGVQGLLRDLKKAMRSIKYEIELIEKGLL